MIIGCGGPRDTTPEILWVDAQYIIRIGITYEIRGSSALTIEPITRSQISDSLSLHSSHERID